MYRLDDLTYFDGYDAIRFYRCFERVGTIAHTHPADGLVSYDGNAVVTVYKVSDKPEDMVQGRIIPVRFLGVVSYNMGDEPCISSKFPQPGSQVIFSYDGHDIRGTINLKGNIIGLGGIPYKETVSGAHIPGGSW